MWLKKSKERDKIQQEIRELNKKRNDYIARENKKAQNSNSLNDAMIKAIRAQAKTKNYTWKKQ